MKNNSTRDLGGVWGGTPSGAQGYSWFIAQASLLVGSGTTWDAIYGTQIGCMQGKHPTTCTVSLATKKVYVKLKV